MDNQKILMLLIVGTVIYLLTRKSQETNYPEAYQGLTVGGSIGDTSTEGGILSSVGSGILVGDFKPTIMLLVGAFVIKKYLINPLFEKFTELDSEDDSGEEFQLENIPLIGNIAGLLT